MEAGTADRRVWWEGGVWRHLLQLLYRIKPAQAEIGRLGTERHQGTVLGTGRQEVFRRDEFSSDLESILVGCQMEAQE